MVAESDAAQKPLRRLERRRLLLLVDRVVRAELRRRCSRGLVQRAARLKRERQRD
jgi:hypothetical protein